MMVKKDVLLWKCIKIYQHAMRTTLQYGQNGSV